MKFNKLMGILLLIGVLCLCIGAVAAVGDVDSHAVGTDNGNLMVENEAVSDTLQSSNGDTLSAGNSWYVKAGATDGDGSEASPYGDLKSALDNTNLQEGDTIYVMSGDYKGESNTGLTIDKNNLNIVSAGDEKPVFDGENSRQIFKITGSNVVLKGLQLTQGKSSNGGALYIDADNVKVDKCTIISNTNSNNQRGGAIYIANHDNVSITNSQINSNNARYSGGAIYNTAPNTLIANCSFSNGIANSGGGIYSDKKIRIVNVSMSSCKNAIINAYGGGICLKGSDASNSVIDNVSFSSSYADQGGAIALVDCDNIIVNNCEVANSISETATGDAYNGDGAAIWMNGDNNLINNTYIHDSQAHGWGIIYVPASSTGIVINNCSFVRNTCSYHGSAIYSRSDDLFVNNSYFEKNHCSRYGGAIYVGCGNHVKVKNSEFVGNYAEKGGAIYLGYLSTSTGDVLRCTNPVIDNCTFTDNGVFPKPPFDRNMSKGGAIFSFAENTTITNSNFTHNVALMGGAIVFEYGRNFLENNTFTNNIAERYGGGAISSTKQGDTINNCTFINNNAKGYGGAVSADYPTITNSKFIGNHAFHGGAICTITANVSDSEFYDNTADDEYYIVAATKLNENNNIHPNQNAISLGNTEYTAMKYDSKNDITYVDGYTAFCVEEDEDSPRYGVICNDLRFLQNSLTEEYVGEYLKILIYKYWNENSDYAKFRDIINIFTDHDFRNSDDATVKEVISLYNSGYRVPTNNTLRDNGDGTIVMFNFKEVIVPSATQNVFMFDMYKTNLTVKKEVITNPVVIGKQVDFNITVKNTGDSNLTSVWINETGFTKGLVYDSFKSSFNWTYNAKDKLWTLNEILPVGKTAYIVLTFNVTESGKMQNNVSVGFSNHTFGNDTVDFTAYVPNMIIEKVSLTPEVTVGMQAYFLIKITNTGECELTNINVTEMNSDGLAYHSYVESPDWIFIGSMDHPKWQYKGILPVGESAEIMVIYNALKAGNFTNIVAIDNNQTSGSGKNDTVIHEPKLKVEKITLTTLVPVGDLTSFVIRVTNMGDCDLEGVYVKELKFDGLVFDHFTSTSGKWIFDGKDKWTYNDILFEGERSQFTVFFKTVKAGNFTNIVVAGSDLTNETPAENTTEAFENETDVNDTEENDDLEEDDTEIYENETSHADELKQSDVNFKNATGNPLLALLAVLLLVGVSRIRKFK